MIIEMTYSALVMLTASVSESVASCNNEQKLACRKAAVDDNLDLLTSGGQCLVRQYVQFTHVCTVTDYLPSIDSCCCVHQALVLCCRYHQDWNHFRCVETDDVVHKFQDNTTPDFHFKIVVPLVLLAVLIIFCIIICPALKMVCCRCHGANRSSSSSSSSAFSRFCMYACRVSSSETSSHKSPMAANSSTTGGGGEGNSTRPPPTQPPAAETRTAAGEASRRRSIPDSHQSSTEEGSQTVLIPLVGAHSSWHTEPSAPPMDGGGDHHPSSGSHHHLLHHRQHLEQHPIAIEYRCVCRRLPINDDDPVNSVAPIILIGCANNECVDLQNAVRPAAAAAVDGIYIAPQLPPTYEEATGRTCATTNLRIQSTD